MPSEISRISGNKRAAFIAVVAICSLTVAQNLPADTAPPTWNDLEEAEDDIVTISAKYSSSSARDRLLRAMTAGGHFHFIQRIVADMPGEAAYALRNDNEITHIEIIRRDSKDTILHRLLEIYRVYTYVLGGRFPISAFNFSQGVARDYVNKGRSGEASIAEALNVLARRAAPVFVAIGNEPKFGPSPWASGPDVFAVVATNNNGKSIFSGSAIPNETWRGRLVLLADGAPRKGKTTGSTANALCGTGIHLHVDHMLSPEDSPISVGGSSFATFTASWNACFVHQYLGILNAHLSAVEPVGTVTIAPFVAYYVDNPVNSDCPALKYRLADRREKYAARYHIDVLDKERLQNFFFGNTVEFNLRYSPRLLSQILVRLPVATLLAGHDGDQRYIRSDGMLTMLRNLRFRDLVEVAANRRSLYYARWLKTADADASPALSSATIDAIDDYCRNRSLFVVLPD